MILAWLFILISIFLSVFSIYKIRQFPKDTLSEKQNYYRMGFYSSIGAFFDFLMTLITSAMIPDGEYGTGAEMVAVFIVIFGYGPLCIIQSMKLRKRMLQKKMRSPSRINALNCSIIFKVAFAFMITIYLCEVV